MLSPGTASAEIIGEGGIYFMNMAIGTPPVQFLGIADTGSDLTWIQCEPCKNCYKQRDPFFNPRNSSTYKNVVCSSKICRSIDGTTNPSCFPRRKKNCEYSQMYEDKSFTRGVVATETVILGSTGAPLVRFPGTVFGCGHNNNGKFSDIGSGLVGLGGGRASLISQMGSSIGRKFSYCLVPHSSSTRSSKMHFGSKALVSGPGVVSTPLFIKSGIYFVTLKGLGIGTRRFELNKSSKGNLIVDSGATLTYIPPQIYFPLETEIKRAIIRDTGLKPVRDPQNFLRLCFATNYSVVAPVVTAHFSGGDVKLSSINTFVGTADDVQCLAFVPNNVISVLGNLAQMNFLVGYDLKKKIVSFKPSDCTKQ
ncbi:Aspartic endopeptidase [Sarracenia purpurea var. burkii]